MDLTSTTSAPLGPETPPPPAVAPEAAARAAWPLAIALSVALGLLFRITLPPGPAPSLPESVWSPFYVWAAAAGVAILVYLWRARGRPSGVAGAATGPGTAQALGAALVIVAFVVNAYALAPPRRPVLMTLAAIHLPALIWFAIGVVVLGRTSNASERFAAVIKSVEAAVTGAIYLAVAGLFAAISMALFAALEMELPKQVMRWMTALLPGLVPVLAVASVYDPGLRPAAQRFGVGLTRLFFIAARLFLPLTLAVLLVVVAVIPTRFAVLASNRHTLFAFNATLFAVMLLLVGATPIRPEDPPPSSGAWLRRGIVGVALLAIVVGGYALAAILSRTTLGGLTANRLTVIGWNLVNLVTLAVLIVHQIRARRDEWVPALHRSIQAGLVLYGLWTVFVLVAIPLVALAAHWPTTIRTPD
jgi:hypothetical protein